MGVYDFEYPPSETLPEAEHIQAEHGAGQDPEAFRGAGVIRWLLASVAVTLAAAAYGIWIAA